MLTKFVFLIKESFKGILRTKGSSFIASLTISISLVSISLLFLIINNIDSFHNSVRENYQIEVFFDDYKTDSLRLVFQNDIMLLDGIKEGMFIDKDKAKGKFASYYNEDVNLIFGINPLPVSTTLSLYKNYQNNDSIRTIVNKIRIIDKVESVYFKEELISKLDTLINNSMFLFAIFSVIIFSISLVIVSNTIHLTILARKETIDILELLGASNFFIRFPYLMEGIICGVFGAILSIVMLSFINELIPIVGAILDYDFVEIENIISINFIFGILMGYIGSYSSINRYI